MGIILGLLAGLILLIGGVMAISKASLLAHMNAKIWGRYFGVSSSESSISMMGATYRVVGALMVFGALVVPFIGMRS
jgi:hypothetical protein